MGKERVRRRQHRVDPIMGRSANGAATQQNGAAPHNNGSVSTGAGPDLVATPVPSSDCADELLSGLQSASAADRARTALVLASLMADRQGSSAERSEAALRSDVIRSAAPLLLDQAAHVRHCAARWLRAACQAGGDARSALVAADILTPLGALLVRLTAAPAGGQGDGAVAAAAGSDDHIAALLDALDALTNLCEHSAIAVDTFTRENLFATAVFPLITTAPESAVRVSIAAAQCLLVATEDNLRLAACFGPAELGALEAVARRPLDTPAHLLLRTTAAAIFHNLPQQSADNGRAVAAELVVGAARNALDRPLATQLVSVTEKVSRLTAVKKGRDLDVENIHEMDKEVDLSLAELTDTLHAKRLALELLANLCFADEDTADDQWEDMDDGSDDDAMSATDDNGAMESSTTAVEPALQDALASGQLLSLVLDHSAPLDEAMATVLGEHPAGRQAVADVREVRCRALLCVDNFAQSVGVDQLGGGDSVRSVVSRLMQMAFAAAAAGGCDYATTADLQDAASSACRALLDALARANERPPALSADEMAAVCAAVRQQPGGPPSSVRLHAARIVATLGTLDRGQLAMAADCLLQAAAVDAELSVLAEAVDALIDAFSDDSTDSAAMACDLVGRLRQLAPRFKLMLKSSPRNVTRMVADTCYSNLQRFVKYKSRRLANGAAC